VVVVLATILLRITKRTYSTVNSTRQRPPPPVAVRPPYFDTARTAAHWPTGLFYCAAVPQTQHKIILNLKTSLWDLSDGGPVCRNYITIINYYDN